MYCFSHYVCVQQITYMMSKLKYDHLIHYLRHVIDRKPLNLLAILSLFHRIIYIITIDSTYIEETYV